ncbi:MAG: hypothetical protein KHZ01_05290 [Lachnospiraceae bacterium]|nr:hypothetical protein [Lachnospiraceae bacterium]
MTENTEKNLSIGKKKKIIMGIVIFVVVGAIVVFFATSKMRNYSKAEKQYEKGNYEEAKKIYLSLGEYKDSKKKYKLSSHMEKVSKDTTMPVIDGVPEEGITVNKGDTSFDIDEWIDNNLKISDDITPMDDIQMAIDDNSFDVNIAGKYNIIYTATDEADNSTEISFDVFVREPSIVKEAYEEAKAIDHTNVEKSKYSVTYHGINIISEEEEWLEDGAIYRSLAKKIEGFYMDTLGKAMYSPTGTDSITLICGVEKQPTWDEMKPYVDKASLMVTRENTLESVMTALQNLDCVVGNFDFANRIFDFEISDLKLASEQLGISEKMLGYTLAMLDEYAPTVEFGENSYKCTWFRR